MADNEDATPRPPAAIPPAAQSNLQPFITQMVDGLLPPRRNPPPEVLGVGSAWVPGPLLSTTTPVSGVVANGGVGSSIAESTGTAANNSGTYRPNGANLEPPPMPIADHFMALFFSALRSNPPSPDVDVVEHDLAICPKNWSQMPSEMHSEL